MPLSNRPRPRRLPIERLGVEMAGRLRVEARVEVQRAGALPGQPRHDEVAAAVGTTVIAENGLRVALCRDRHRRQQAAQPADPSPRHTITAGLAVPAARARVERAYRSEGTYHLLSLQKIYRH